MLPDVNGQFGAAGEPYTAAHLFAEVKDLMQAIGDAYALEGVATFTDYTADEHSARVRVYSIILPEGDDEDAEETDELILDVFFDGQALHFLDPLETFMAGDRDKCLGFMMDYALAGLPTGDAAQLKANMDKFFAAHARALNL